MTVNGRGHTSHYDTTLGRGRSRRTGAGAHVEDARGSDKLRGVHRSCRLRRQALVGSRCGVLNGSDGLPRFARSRHVVGHLQEHLVQLLRFQIPAIHDDGHDAASIADVPQRVGFEEHEVS